MEGPNTQYMPAVDHLRFFAALIILVFHGVARYYWPVPGWPQAGHWPTLFITEGYASVGLFMVLSGFILTYVAWGHSVVAGAFFRNRALRLLPLLTVAFLVAALADPRMISTDFLWVVVRPAKVTHLGATAGVLWTVFVEIELYLMFPTLLRHLQQGGPRRMLAIIALLAGLRFVVVSAGADEPTLLYYSVLSRADQFILGMVAASLLRKYASRLWSLALPAGLALCIVLMASLGRGRLFADAHNTALGHRWAVLSPTVEGLGWALVVIGYVTFMQGRRGIVVRALASIGATSYSIYLFHSFVISTLLTNDVMLRLGGSRFAWATATSVLVALPITLVAARLGYTLIELPFLRRRVRWIEQHRPAPLPLPARAAS